MFRLAAGFGKALVAVDMQGSGEVPGQSLCIAIA